MRLTKSETLKVDKSKSGQFITWARLLRKRSCKCDFHWVTTLGLCLKQLLYTPKRVESFEAVQG